MSYLKITELVSIHENQFKWKCVDTCNNIQYGHDGKDMLHFYVPVLHQEPVVW